MIGLVIEEIICPIIIAASFVMILVLLWMK